MLGAVCGTWHCFEKNHCAMALILGSFFVFLSSCRIIFAQQNTTRTQDTMEREISTDETCHFHLLQFASHCSIPLRRACGCTHVVDPLDLDAESVPSREASSLVFQDQIPRSSIRR